MTDSTYTNTTSPAGTWAKLAGEALRIGSLAAVFDEDAQRWARRAARNLRLAERTPDLYAAYCVLVGEAYGYAHDCTEDADRCRAHAAELEASARRVYSASA